MRWRDVRVGMHTPSRGGRRSLISIMRYLISSVSPSPSPPPAGPAPDALSRPDRYRNPTLWRMVTMCDAGRLAQGSAEKTKTGEEAGRRWGETTGKGGKHTNIPTSLRPLNQCRLPKLKGLAPHEVAEDRLPRCAAPFLVFGARQSMMLSSRSKRLLRVAFRC
jgi:hypothetical protein